MNLVPPVSIHTTHDTARKTPDESLRLEALGDGIFSIAMTIMVIELKFPEVEIHSFQEFVSAIAAVKYHFLCYIISFIVLGHHVVRAPGDV